MAHVLSLSQGTWEVAATAAGSLRTLDDLATLTTGWFQATGVTTAAAAQREMGAWSDAMANRQRHVADFVEEHGDLHRR